MRFRAALFYVTLIMVPVSSVQADVMYPFETAKQESQFKHLLTELRCLVCQNQDLSDSNAGLANDLRMEVYNKVRDGQSDQEIIAFLTDRYGDFILFKPPFKGLTLLLWSAPFIFLTLGLFIFWRKVRLPRSVA